MPRPLEAGVFRFAASEVREPFIVVHPPGYDGMTGGTLEVRVCAVSGMEHMVPAIEEAISVWNDLAASNGNCSFCEVWEEPANPDLVGAPQTMADVLIHEMGHCIFGLDHSNSDLGGENSFTNTANVTVFDAGSDGIRGSRDDLVVPLPGADVVHWFRTADNNPFALDPMPVDSSSYSRRITDLMTLGHGWAANANRIVGEDLGVTNTQAVMNSGQVAGQRFGALAPDDAHTVQFGMSGMDETAGTSDDYTIRIVFEGSDCSNADVHIDFTTPMLNPDALGVCLNDIAALPNQGLLDIHHTITGFMSMPITLEVNPAMRWDVLFASGFESGSSSEWDSFSR